MHMCVHTHTHTVYPCSFVSVHIHMIDCLSIEEVVTFSLWVVVAVKGLNTKNAADLAGKAQRCPVITNTLTHTHAHTYTQMQLTHKDTQLLPTLCTHFLLWITIVVRIWPSKHTIGGHILSSGKKKKKKKRSKKQWQVEMQRRKQTGQRITEAPEIPRQEENLFCYAPVHYRQKPCF